MSETATAPDSRTTCVPACTLVFSEHNVSKDRPRRNIEALAASILAQGLYQNLVVTEEEDGTHPVQAGERRRQALAWLITENKIPADWPVPVRIVPESWSTTASLTENFHRESMHPADEVVAFHDLTVQGWSIDRIADAYGVTPLVVERRLSLARAAPSLFEKFRNDEITTEQMMALCASDDHERQEAAWNSSPSYYRGDPAYLRRAVVAGEVEASSDRRVAFIGGVEAYVAAGGDVRPDLFSNQLGGGFITDIGLLERLVAEKLEEAAAKLRDEGWGWVEIWPDWDWTVFNRLGRITRTATVLSPEAEAKMAELEAGFGGLEADAEAFGENAFDYDELSDAERERFDAIHTRMEEIEDEIAAIRDAQLAFEPDAVRIAGAVVAMESGKLRIERGLVRAADRPKVAEAVGGSHALAGGRESNVAGRKPGALSDTLTRSLLAHRNLAAQTATAGNPYVAKVLLACWIVQAQRYRLQQVPFDFRISEVGSGTRTQHPFADEEGATKRKAFEAAGATLTAELPKEDDALWDALTALPGDELDRLIAFGVASAVSLSSTHSGLTAKLLEALGFDMADHFTATADTFFGRVSKAQIVEALADAGKISGEAQRAALTALKKPDLAARAEAELADTRWVPGLIRTPKPGPANSATTASKRKRKPKDGGGTRTKKPAGQRQAKTPGAKGRRSRTEAPADIRPVEAAAAAEAEVAPGVERMAA